MIAGGPCAQNPEPMAPFIDVFVTGDGEPSLPRICDLWLELQGSRRQGRAGGGRQQREELLLPTGRSAALLLRAAILRAGVPRRGGWSR